jgi:RNA polymerase sigma-70 factor (ECF subfamily)
VEEIVRTPVATDSEGADQAPKPTDQQDVGTPRRHFDEATSARDKALVERAVAGDLEAFNQLVALYQDYLFSLVVRVVNDRDSASDAVQEAFFSCYRNIHRFRGDSFRSWLTRIALNAATDILRYRKRRPADPYPEWEDDSWQPPAGEEASPEREAVRRNTARILSQALAQITPDQRAAIVLYDVEGYDYQEIADMTHVSLGTVKSRIHRGRLALRDLLGGDVELLRE